MLLLDRVALAFLQWTRAENTFPVLLVYLIVTHFKFLEKSHSHMNWHSKGMRGLQ